MDERESAQPVALRHANRQERYCRPEIDSLNEPALDNSELRPILIRQVIPVRGAEQFNFPARLGVCGEVINHGSALAPNFLISKAPGFRFRQLPDKRAEAGPLLTRCLSENLPGFVTQPNRQCGSHMTAA
jgi:hypothetical protein